MPTATSPHRSRPADSPLPTPTPTPPAPDAPAQDNHSADVGEAPDQTAAAQPVFVDSTGRRRRLWTWFTRLLGLLALAYATVAAISAFGGPVTPADSSAPAGSDAPVDAAVRTPAGR